MEGIDSESVEKVVRLPGVARPAPRVSVVIPTYNSGGSLRRLLVALSLGEQPAGGMEIVVVDDGSADHTAAVATAVGARYIWKENGGTASARDRGWREAHGERIVFFDDDTLPARDAVVLLDRALDRADAVGAQFVGEPDDTLIGRFTHADSLIDHRVIGGSVRWLITGAAAFRRSALEAVDGFDLGFNAAGEDVDLSIRLIESGFELALEPRALVRHYHRNRFAQLLETCYRYGMYSKDLARRHQLYREQRTMGVTKRLSPAEWRNLYRSFRRGENRRTSLLFLGLHQLLPVPYALGMLRGSRGLHAPSAPSWRRHDSRTVQLSAEQVAADIFLELNGSAAARREQPAEVPAAV